MCRRGADGHDYRLQYIRRNEKRELAPLCFLHRARLQHDLHSVHPLRGCDIIDLRNLILLAFFTVVIYKFINTALSPDERNMLH